MEYFKIQEVQDSLTIDIQLLATDLDCSANEFLLIKNEGGDGFPLSNLDKEKFEVIFSTIRYFGVFVQSFDDNTDLYLYNDKDIILHSYLGFQCIIFKPSARTTIESMLKQV